MKSTYYNIIITRWIDSWNGVQKMQSKNRHIAVNILPQPHTNARIQLYFMWSARLICFGDENVDFFMKIKKKWGTDIYIAYNDTTNSHSLK